jgi:uncharacterized protein
VQPRAAQERLGPAVGDRLKVAVNAPPVDGKANEAVIRLIASTLGIPRSSVEIARGETGRRKTLRIRGVTRAALARFLD